MPDSIHTARWISQISNLGWKIHFFPTYLSFPHVSYENLVYYSTSLLSPKQKNSKIKYIHWPTLFFIFNWLIRKLSHKETTKYKELALKIIIKIVKPDIVHSLEFQHAGYITLGVKKSLQQNFPMWIATNYGSDIYLFNRLTNHQKIIKEILENCDYYACECDRDVELVKKLGFKGEILPVLPNTGGINLNKLNIFSQPELPSQRRKIIIKGYQHWAGRALVALQALRFCIEKIKDYCLLIYSASEDVRIAAELFAQDTNIKVKLIEQVSHEELLQLFGESRIYIGLSISDGISTSLLEAMTMGTFPIQSYTSCANEWIVQGISGMLVPPEDPVAIAKSIIFALSNDDLVNEAAKINNETIKQRLDYKKIQNEVINVYESIYSKRRSKS